MAGAPAKLAPKRPNVRVYLAVDRIRRQELGKMFGDLLLALPEWADVIGGTGLDPIKDFDHVLLSGPEFKDPSHVIAVMDYNTSSTKIRNALLRAMARSKPRGKWERQRPIPVASVGPKLRHRVAVIAKKRLLVMFPPSVMDRVHRFNQMKGFNKSGKQDIVLYMAKPRRAFRGTGVRVPASIKWMRLVLTAVAGDGKPAGGGYILDVEAEDVSPEAAKKNAQTLRDRIEDIRVIDFLIGKIEVIGRPQWDVVGKRIFARTTISLKQIKRIIRWVKKRESERLKRIAKRRAKRKKSPPKPKNPAVTPSATPSGNKTSSPKPRPAPVAP